LPGVISGIALSGVFFFNPLNNQEEDAVLNETRLMDKCLSHPTAFGFYHYHIASPCLKKQHGIASTSQIPDFCPDDPQCAKPNTKTFFVEKGYPVKKLEIIGLAKDGHIIYGPYNKDGELWTCSDVDLCNGRFFDDGSYGYVATTTFPYTVGCFGPAPNMSTTAGPKCSINSCFAVSMLSQGVAAAVVAFVVAIF